MSAVPDDWSPPSEIEEYRLLSPLGRGAMGQVFLAHDTLLDRKVAVKFVAGSAIDPALRAQFFVEARAIARLSHPNVVAIHRVGEIKRRPYLISELVHGTSLAELPRPVSPGRLLEIGVGLSRGLAAAHRRGVLHRDLKPANAMITGEGEVKLLDFGLAQLLDRPGAPAALDASSGRARVGSPLYMAPEIWRHEPATFASDVYSIGVLLYELAAGHAPNQAATEAELARVTQEREAPPLRQQAPGVDPRLCAVIDGCLAHDPTRRWASGDALREALEALMVSARAVVPEGNPYRGLLAFDVEHQGLFFGREAEAGAILDRLRAEPFVVVAGDSGVGKSSLCRAGVLPRLDRRVVQLVPGRQPLAALCAALAPLLSLEERELAKQLGDDPRTLGRLLRRSDPMVLFVDQLEELATVSAPDEVAAVAAALASLAIGAPGVRLVATVRSDFLTRLASLPVLGPEIARALYLLPALSAQGVRDATVGPATAKGVRFETPAMIDALVAVADEPGGLPLLQFALAALWDAREVTGRLIPAAALERMGGPAGALARHADGVMAALVPAERGAAQRILMQLVTAESTRARRSEDDLVRGDVVTRAGLEALVRGRLIVAREETYEIAHEALVARWDTLRGWLSKDGERRAGVQRLERAAVEWDRLGRARDALWSKTQLAEAATVGVAASAGREGAFLAASRRAVRRRRGARWAALVGLPALALAVFGSSKLQQRRELGRRVDGWVAQADLAAARRGSAATRFERLRAEAFARFDALAGVDGEARWAEALVAARQADEAGRAAGDALEAALRLDSARADVRARFGDLLVERARLAEQTFQERQRDELLARLVNNDEDGSRRARWNAPGVVELATPRAAPLQLFRYQAYDGHRQAVALPAPQSRSLELSPGSYLVEVAGTRMPFVVERGERRRLTVAPPDAAVPEGFVFVPAGRFLFGSSGDEELRHTFYGAPPLHPVDSGPYLIARNETTYADWIAYLEALPRAERARHLVAGSDFQGVGVALLKDGGVWRLELRSRAATYHARWGESIHYLERSRGANQDWRRMPVAGVTYRDAQAYAGWLSSSGRMPGARLCTELEWERAARGADDREYPHGDRLDPEDANFDLTYGQKLDAFGPDEVGTHRASRSPFGVDDLAGNIFEWASSSMVKGESVVRGGCYYYNRQMNRVYYREVISPGDRTQMIGVRICADAR